MPPIPTSCAQAARAALLVTILAGCTRSPDPALAPLRSTGAGDPRGDFAVEGRVSAIGATPNGRVMLTTMSGALYATPRLGGEWSEVIDSAKPRGEGFSRLNRAMRGSIGGFAFADDARGVAWGTLPVRATNVEDSVMVFITADSGAHWTSRTLGPGFQLAAGDIRTNGDYWLAGYAMGGRLGDPVVTVIYRSTDFGESWRAMPAPGGQRPTSDFVMDDDGTGLLAALDNKLFVTRDTGRRWEAIPTPLDQRAYTKPARDTDWARIERAKLARGWLMVQQDGRVFTSRLDSIAWSPVEAGSVRFFTLDRSTRAWCVLDGQWRLRTGREPSRLSDPRAPGLLAPVVSAECKDGSLHAVDVEGRVYAVSDDHGRHEFPLTTSGPRMPLIREQERGNAQWSASVRSLYGTANGGRTWYRHPFTASTVAGFLMRTNDEVFVWDGHGTNSRFDRRTGRTHAVESLAGRDVVQVFDLDSIWIAFGGKQYETAARVEVAQTFFAGQFRGTADFGFVLISRDAGATWSEIDRWAESGVAALHVGANADHMVAFSYLGAVREIRRTPGGFAGTTLLAATSANRQSVPYVQTPAAVHFPAPDTGFITGDIHHVGTRTFKTVDGGRTWTRIPFTEFPFSGLMRAGRDVLAWDRSRLYRVSGSAHSVIATVVSDSTREWITAVSRPDRGRVLVHVSVLQNQHRSVSRMRVDLRSGKVERIP